MSRITTGWNFMRALRLVLAIAIIAQGIVARDWLFVAMGVLFGGMAVFGIGCCGANGCATKPTNENINEPLTFEEVK